METLFGLDKLANVENYWNLHRHDFYRSVVDRLSMTANEADALLASAKSKMAAARLESEPRPVVDHKIITAWNGLAIKGLPDAGRLAQQHDWIDLALLRKNSYALIAGTTNSYAALAYQRSWPCSLP